MRLPKDILTGTMTKPSLFLCETNKERICQLETSDMHASLKFNAYSELTFTVGRTYTNMITGETQVNPFYNKIEALRLVYLEGFGYFEIQDPEIVSDGIKEVKNVTAYSLEYTLSQKYLENFNINTGEVDSIEVIHANGGLVVPITLYNEAEPGLSLLNLALEKIYGWTIGHVDSSLKTMGRTFEISRASVYDFIVQDICEKFNCFAVFNTIDNTINLYAEALITKHIGDGDTTSFMVSPPYSSLGYVSIDSYKTTAYIYNSATGELIFETAPADGAKIEIADGSQEQWTTDVYVSFDNLAQEANISYSADDIKTVLTVKGADDLDIREVNMGLPYIVDLSYYYSIDWMGKDLYDAYTKYLQTSSSSQSVYVLNAKDMQELQNQITYEEQRLSLKYSIAENVTSTTVGTYYIRGGTSPNYYYKEIKLPDEYSANIEHYYMLSGTDLNEEKFSDLYKALQVYFASEDAKDVSEIDKLTDSFAFMEVHTISSLSSILSNATNISQKDNAILNFLDEMWTQLGRTSLETLYYKPYKVIEETNKQAGWDKEENANYWRYYPVLLILDSLQKEIADREVIIQEYQDQYDTLQEENNKIANDASIYNNFSHDQLIRLSAFLREDEYTDDNFVETSTDTVDALMQTKQELLECGKIELAKLCEPKLAFSMDMANIYALPEFEPIIDQFQLGNLINVVIRSDYIKRARLLAVDINFDDFSDFSCEFGELTNLRTPSSIHADLLANALTAGKSVASNASYWNKSSDAVTSLSLLIQQGLLDAATTIKAIDGNQGVSIDKYGIHLQKFDPETGEKDPKEGWIINNQFLYSDDNFRTTKSVFGEYKIDGQTKWGLLAEAVMAGYIAGSTIVGGTIDIGEGTFTVDSNGHVVATSGEIAGWTIKPNALFKELTVDNMDYKMYLQVPDGNIAINAFAVRSRETGSDGWDTQFAVSYKGKMTAKNADVTGDITANSLTLGSNVQIPYSKLSDTPNLDIYIAKDGTVGDTPAEGSTGFKVSKSGLLKASNAVIYGTLYSSKGEIAGWSIYDNVLRKETTVNGVDYQMYMQSTDGVNTTNAFAVRKKKSGETEWETQFAVSYAGKMTARNAHVTGTIVAQDGTIAGYNIGPGGSYDDAIYKRVSGDDVDYEVGLKATSGDTDLSFYVKESTDNWSSSSNTFYVRNNGQLYAQKADITGKITASSGSIGSWKIGDMGSYTDSIYSTYCAASSPSSSNPEYAVFMRGKGEEKTLAFGVKKRTSSSTSWNDAENPFYVRKDGYVVMTNANVSGTVNATAGNIGGCSISDGVLNISAANITSGTIATARIPNLNASKITSGTISTSRLDAAVITTENFSSKTLSTANLTMASGCRLGVASEYNAKLYSSGGYTWMEAFTSSSSSYLSSIMNIVRAGVNVASTRDIKHEIHDFDDRYDVFFDKLNPQLFKYNFESDLGYSMGFIWEEARLSMDECGLTENDMGAIHESEGTIGGKVFRKDDFVALNTWQIQKLKNRVEELEKRLTALEA